MTKFFQLGMLLAVAVSIAIFALERERDGASRGLFEADAVLVFTIPQPERMARVRKAIADERVLLEGEEGFSLVSGRVYVRDVGAAGDLIQSGGWVDRPVRIIGLGIGAVLPDASGRSGVGPGADLSPAERLARIRQLVSKPSLTRGEQVFVLQAMNDGLEI